MVEMRRRRMLRVDRGRNGAQICQETCFVVARRRAISSEAVQTTGMMQDQVILVCRENVRKNIQKKVTIPSKMTQGISKKGRRHG
jgi:hypothetical protein